MGQYDYSTYPDQIDSYGTMPIVRDGIDEIVAAHHNALRSALIAIESELGTNPSSSYTTVRARLDSIGDASSQIAAHLVDAIDAHDASAISITDSGNSYVAVNVEDALSELAAVLPSTPNVIGEPVTTVPNTGVPNFIGGAGSLFLFNTGAGANVLKKTQPVTITGLHVIEIGSTNSTGTAQLRFNAAVTIQWSAPNDAFGSAVSVASLLEGGVVTVYSSDTTKAIRVARTSASLPIIAITESFEVLRLDAQDGCFSIDGSGIQTTNYITRTATTATGTGRNQFVIGGTVYPADKGTLVLQRKLNGSTEFDPVAVLDLSANFTESLRETEQPVYAPDLEDYDSITLFDRLPARNDYETLDNDANGNQVYSNFSINEMFPAFQLAKYSIPVSNVNLVGGALEASINPTAAEIEDRVSSYRVVHYIDGITDFNGDPDSSDIFSVQDVFGGTIDDGDSNVRMSQVFVDSNTERPNLDAVVLRPVLNAEVHSKIISGIHYYNHEDDKFDLELRTKDTIFQNTYKYYDIVQFTSDAFEFPSTDGYGESIRVVDLLDDGYIAYSNTNLPDFTDTTKDHGFYLVNSVYNTSKRLYPGLNKFSTNAFISAQAADPFNSGEKNDAYGLITSAIAIQVNSYDENTATSSEEFFVEETYRNGTAETYANELDPNQFTHNYGPSAGGHTLTVWDSTLPLTAGDLQIGGLTAHNINSPGLIWPQFNYTGNVRPTQQAGVSYNAAGFAAVDSKYQRLFSLGYPISNGKIRIKSSGDYLVAFDDIVLTNTSRPIKVELKIPGSGASASAWLDLGKPYQFGKLDTNGDGCMTYVEGVAGDFVVHITFGQRCAINSMIALRVTYFSAQYDNARKRIISYVALEAQN